MTNTRPLKAYAFVSMTGLMLLGCPGDDTSATDAEGSSSGSTSTTSTSGSPTSVTETITMTTTDGSTSTMTGMTSPTMTEPDTGSTDEDSSSSDDGADTSSSSDDGADTSSSSDDAGSTTVVSTTTDPGSSSSSSSTTDPGGDFYGDCFSMDEADVCNLVEGEACIGLEFDGVDFLGGAVCMELNCIADGDCAPAPAGSTSVPVCQDIGLGVGSCFLDCTADTLGCPAGMHCTFEIGGIETTGVCLFPEAEDDWTCFPGHYDDGICDCGCGVVDPDCPTGVGTAECVECDTFGSCSTDPACSDIDPLDNSQCVGGGDTEVLEASPALPLPQGAYDGTLGSMACTTLTSVASGNDTITNVFAEFQLNHTWVGDLVIKIQSPAGANPVTILHLPGTTDPGDDGIDVLDGNDSDLVDTDTIIFHTPGVTDAEAMGIAGGFVCNRGGAGDGLCDYFPNAGEAIAGDFTTFIGEDATGDWQVCVGDFNAFDGGSFEFVRLTIEQN